jgi:hypothetical protein
MSQKIILNKSNFLFLLESLSKINDTAILNIKNGEIYFISNSEDASLILWGRTEIDFEEEKVLNIPSVSKLSSALKMCDGSDDITLILNNNNLEYRGNKIKFKYHLYEDGLIAKTKMSLEKIKSISYDIEFNVSKNFIKNLLKTNSAFSDSNKLYIYTNDGQLYWSLQDKTSSNSDVICITSGNVDFELSDFIINLDNLRLLTFIEDNDFNFKINTKFGVANINLNFEKVYLNYIISSLVK